MCEDCARERAAREEGREKRRAAAERANEEARLHTQVTGELLRERSRLAAALDALRDQARCPECGKDTCDLHHVLNMAEAAKTIVVKTRVLLARAALAGGGR